MRTSARVATGILTGTGHQPVLRAVRFGQPWHLVAELSRLPEHDRGEQQGEEAAHAVSLGRVRSRA